jgi:hypothetical protein
MQSTRHIYAYAAPFAVAKYIALFGGIFDIREELIYAHLAALLPGLYHIVTIYMQPLLCPNCNRGNPTVSEKCGASMGASGAALAAWHEAVVSCGSAASLRLLWHNTLPG